MAGYVNRLTLDNRLEVPIGTPVVGNYFARTRRSLQNSPTPVRCAKLANHRISRNCLDFELIRRRTSQREGRRRIRLQALRNSHLSDPTPPA